MFFKFPKYQFRNYSIRLFIFCLLLLWCSGFLLFYLFPSSSELNIYYPIVKKIYSGVCHQQADKCLSSATLHYLLCYRCSGVYVGALFASLLPAAKKIKTVINLFLISSGILLSDVLLNTVGIKEYDSFTALFTGIFAGISAMWLLISFLREQILLRKVILDAE